MTLTKHICAVAIAFVLSGIAVLAWPYRVPDGDNFVGSVTMRDVGAMTAESSSTISLTIVNPFDQPLTVVGITTSCGCTGAEMRHRKISSRGFEVLDVHMKAPKSGLFSTVVTVQFSNNAVSTFRILGVVK